jgi:hypothetical protein
MKTNQAIAFSRVKLLGHRAVRLTALAELFISGSMHFTKAIQLG